MGVAYGSDPRRVLTLLREVAQGTPGISATPVPAIVFKGFGTSSLDFSIRAWTDNFGDWVTIRTEMTARVYEALTGEGIEIPYPQQAIHIRSVSPGIGQQLAPSDSRRRRSQRSRSSVGEMFSPVAARGGSRQWRGKPTKGIRLGR